MDTDPHVAAPVEGRTSLCTLFFLHAAAMAAYIVPFPNVLQSYGLAHLAPWALATGGVASFISPMFAGYLADRRVPPERLLAVLAFTSGVLLILVHCAIWFGWGGKWFMGLMMAYAIANAPGFSLVTSIVMSRLTNVQQGFGPIRVWATWGWMTASWMVSGALHLDVSPAAGMIGGGLLLIESIFCLSLSPSPRPAQHAPRRLRDLFGWDALTLLRHPDHRVLFICSIIFTALLSPLYLYTTPHLRDGGDSTPAATMAWAQVCEGITMLCLGFVLNRFRLKWVLTTALLMGLGRYCLMAMDVRWAMVSSVCLHGAVFVLWYATTQIYMEQRVDPSMRSQGQALLSLLNNGIGNLAGYALISRWHTVCLVGPTMDWPRFWTALAWCVAAVVLIFVTCYRGQKRTH